MILSKKIYILLFTNLIFFSCNSTIKTVDLAEASNTEDSSGIKNELVTMYENGQVKTTLNFKHGKKNGKAITYYNNGKPLLELNYKDGLREGMSIKYFEHGGIYALTPYENDKINGIRILYYSTGEKKAEIPYKNNLIGVGLKEYLKNGELINLDYNLTVRVNSENIVSVNADKRCKKAVFYIGYLVNENFLDPGSTQVSILSHIDPLTGFKDLTKSQLDYYKDKRIICECTTKHGNPLILISSTIEKLIPNN